jgi:hypothetical protein
MVISEKNIVGTMHEAYKILGLPTTAGFGVFIAGLSACLPPIIRWLNPNDSAYGIKN